MSNSRFKFRVWDKRYKICCDTKYKKSPDGHMVYCDPSEAFVISDMGGEIMQFTGLKDKNGKEIYEGDILKHTPKPKGCFWDGRKIHITKIVFDKAAFSEILLHNGDDAGMLGQDPSYYEVIGNIYENPELLKDTK